MGKETAKQVIITNTSEIELNETLLNKKTN